MIRFRKVVKAGMIGLASRCAWMAAYCAGNPNVLMIPARFLNGMLAAQLLLANGSYRLAAWGRRSLRCWTEPRYDDTEAAGSAVLDRCWGHEHKHTQALVVADRIMYVESMPLPIMNQQS